MECTHDRHERNSGFSFVKVVDGATQYRNSTGYHGLSCHRDSIVSEGRAATAALGRKVGYDTKLAISAPSMAPRQVAPVSRKRRGRQCGIDHRPWRASSRIHD